VGADLDQFNQLVTADFFDVDDAPRIPADGTGWTCAAGADGVADGGQPVQCRHRLQFGMTGRLSSRGEHKYQAGGIDALADLPRSGATDRG
jgi:hypothetical protein